MEQTQDNKKHILLSTDIFNYTYQDYLDWCDECDIPEDERFGEDEDGGHLFNEWRHEQVEQDIDCDCENMRYSEYANRSFVITGHLGLWDGKHEIIPAVHNGLVDTIMKCTEGNDIWDYDVFINDDEDYITIHAKHHDGTNVFLIHLMTQEGAKTYKEAYDDWDNCITDEKPEVKPEYFEKIEFEKIF